jgi:hypothetical protein
VRARVRVRVRGQGEGERTRAQSTESGFQKLLDCFLSARRAPYIHPMLRESPRMVRSVSRAFSMRWKRARDEK